MSEKNELTAQPQIMAVSEVATRIGMVQEVMKGVMKQDTHYGVIPGCGDKPTLLQPGAQVLSVTFGIYAEPVEHIVTDLPNGHREVRTKIAMKRLDNDRTVSFGFGVCSTMERKYRFTKGESRVTDQQVPKAYWDAKKMDPKKAQELIGGPGHGTKKVDGVWYVTEGSDEKVENTNPADYFNTVDKISFKRAYVHAVINATACSDIFTQDIEDMADVIRNESQFIPAHDVSPAPYNYDRTAEAVKPEESPTVDGSSESAPEKPKAKEKTGKPKPETESPMTEAMRGAIKGGFLAKNAKFNDEWFNRMTPNPVTSDRAKYAAVYTAVDTQRISIADAVGAENLDALMEKL